MGVVLIAFAGIGGVLAMRDLSGLRQQVTHVFARDRATYAATPTAEYMLDATIVELERKLDPAKFFRIHRGTLLNIGWVSELHADLGGQLVVRLRGEKQPELIVSRDRVRPLKERLGLT